jgi:protein-S-isoprenylcysteine O-methyltransferase Ste14
MSSPSRYGPPPYPFKPGELPRSATNFGINLVGLAVVFVTIAVLRAVHAEPGQAVFALVFATAVPIILLDLLVLRVHRRESTGIDWDKEYDFDLGRLATKLLGLAFTLLLIGIAYWAFPEYSFLRAPNGNFYDAFYFDIRRFWPVLALTSVIYFAMVDGQMRAPRDAYWQLGRALLGHPSEANRSEIANHFLSWLVKAFFFPLMLVWLSGNVRDIVTIKFSTFAYDNLALYHYGNTLFYGLDLLFCVVGYALSVRIIDSHIRTAEPTPSGWAVALFCYPPFYPFFERLYVNYGTGFDFEAWLGPHVAIRWIWAAVTLALVAIYVSATVVFGVRFSNLTHRGILTNGPYRFSKHPAYISKNLSWWLVSVPFLDPHGGFETVRHCVLLGCVNMIYFLRARTEERHLSRDPTYVAYALWMNEHGLLAFLGRWFPLLRYKPPATAEAAPQRVAAPAE